MPGDWQVRFLGGPGVARRRAYPTKALAPRAQGGKAIVRQMRGFGALQVAIVGCGRLLR